MNSARGKWLPECGLALFDWFALKIDKTELVGLTMLLPSTPLAIWYGFRLLVSGGSERCRLRIRSNFSSIERGGGDPTTFGLFSWLGKVTESGPCSRVLLGTVIKLFLIKVLLMHFPPCLCPPIFRVVEVGLQAIWLPWMKSNHVIPLSNLSSLNVVYVDSFSSRIKWGWSGWWMHSTALHSWMDKSILRTISNKARVDKLIR